MSGSKGINIATLFLSVVPEFDGIEGKVGAAFGAPIEKEADEAGKKSGKKFGASFADNMKTSLAALGLGKMVTEAFGNAMETQGATNKMTAAMGLTPEESAKYGQIAGALYADNYGSSMESVTEAVDNVASTLVKTGKAGEGELQGLTGKAMSLASAFGVDVAEAANTAGTVMNSGLAKNATEAFDLIANAGQKVPAKMRGEIFPVMDEYSKHFAALGIDGTTAFGIMTMAARNGEIGMDKAGDAIKEFQIRSTDMSKSTGTAYETLGLDQHKMTNAILGGGKAASDAFGQIVHKLQEINDPAAQSAAALALFGTPLEDLGVDQIPNFLGAIDPMGDAFDKVDGKAASLDETMSGGAAGGLAKFNRAVETTMSSLATSMLPTLTKVLDVALPMVKGLEPLAPLLFGLAVAFGVLAAAMWVASLTPMTLIISGILIGVFALAAGIMWLVQNWSAVWDSITVITGGFLNWMGEVFGGFANWWNELWGGFGNGVTDAWNGITGKAQEIWGGFINWWNQLWGGFGNWTKEIWDGMVNGIKQVWDGFIAWITPGWRVWAKITDTAWRLITDGVKFLWGGLMNWVKEIWDGFMAWLQPGLDFFKGIWDQVWGAISGTATAVWGAISTTFTAMWTAFVGVVQVAVGWFAGIWNAVWTGVSGAVTTAWNAVISAASIVMQTLVAWIMPGLYFIRDIWNAVWNWISGVVGTVWANITGTVQAGIDGVVGLVNGIGASIGDFFGGLVNDAVSWGTNIIQGLLDGLSSMGGQVESFFNTLIPGWIIDPFKEALDIHSPSRVFYALGENTGDGYLNGTASKKDLIKKSMETMVAIPATPKSSATPAPAFAAAGSSGDTFEIHPAPGMDEVLLAQHISNNNRRAARR